MYILYYQNFLISISYICSFLGVASGVLGSFVVISAIYFYQRRKTKSYLKSHSLPYVSSSTDLEWGSQHFGVQLFTYSELEEATNHFDPSNGLGKGGFGTVYFGKNYHIFHN